MSRGKSSGIRLDREDVAVVLGMQKRGDRDHDIAAWFGVNQGRVAEAKEGRWGKMEPTPANELPPKGPPGLKGRDIRFRVERALEELNKGDVAAAKLVLLRAVAKYDANER